MITINLNKAKTISHDIRRQKRSKEFAPLDEVIMKQVPGTDLVAIETERQQIRDRYANLQTQIDTVQTVTELSSIVEILRN